MTRNPRRYLFGGLPLVLELCAITGCSDEFSLGRSLWQDTYLQANSLTVDVLFVVDNSPSMQGEGQEQERVSAAFNDFISNIQAANVDFHVGVTTTDMAEGGAQGKLTDYNGTRYITSEMSPDLYTSTFVGMIGVLPSTQSGFEKGLWAAKAALFPVSEGGQSGEGGYNEGFLRDDAKLAIIFVSDENDCSDEGNPLPGEDQDECYTMIDSLRSVYAYESDYQTLKESDDDIVASAIVGLRGVDPETECGMNTSAGTRYMDLVQDLGGVIGDICQSEFSSILSQMSLSASGLRTHFVLSRTPQVDSISVKVNDAVVESGHGWRYDPETNAIDFYGEAIPPRDSSIVITYYMTPG